MPFLQFAISQNTMSHFESLVGLVLEDGSSLDGKLLLARLAFPDVTGLAVTVLSPATFRTDRIAIRLPQLYYKVYANIVVI